MKKLKDLPEWVIVLISAVMFGLGFLFGHAEVLIALFTFLIIMEVVRTITEYVLKPHNRMKIRYAVDGAIFFALRELFVGWLMLKTSTVIGLVIMVASLVGLVIIVFVRSKVIKESPENMDKFYCTSSNCTMGKSL